MPSLFLDPATGGAMGPKITSHSLWSMAVCCESCVVSKNASNHKTLLFWEFATRLIIFTWMYRRVTGNLGTGTDFSGRLASIRY